MTTRPLPTWIGNAAAVFSKVHGAVTHQAQQAGCSRQTVYQHARQLEQRLDTAAHDELLAEDQRPRDRVEALSRLSELSVACDPAKLRQVATIALAAGVSLRQIEDVFESPAPRRQQPPTIRRSVDGSHKRPRRPRPSSSRSTTACAAEGQDAGDRRDFFGGRPDPRWDRAIEHDRRVLPQLGQGPHRGELAATSWPASRPWSSPSPTPPRGSPRGWMARRRQRQRRSDDDPTPLGAGPGPLFHTVREARTVLHRGVWQGSPRRPGSQGRGGRRADGGRSKRAGVDARGVAQASAAAWRRAESGRWRTGPDAGGWRGARVRGGLGPVRPGGPAQRPGAGPGPDRCERCRNWAARRGPGRGTSCGDHRSTGVPGPDA